MKWNTSLLTMAVVDVDAKADEDELRFGRHVDEQEGVDDDEGLLRWCDLCERWLGSGFAYELCASANFNWLPIDKPLIWITNNLSNIFLVLEYILRRVSYLWSLIFANLLQIKKHLAQVKVFFRFTIQENAQQSMRCARFGRDLVSK